MIPNSIQFSHCRVVIDFDVPVSSIISANKHKQFFCIADEQVGNSLGFLKDHPHATIKAIEKNKIQATADAIISKMLEEGISKNVCVLGIGGGITTDIAAYVASVYKRGTQLILVPTTLLGMVDAAIGGKNGVNVGNIKNMVGTIYQPEKIVYDFEFLNTLPDHEWRNGFAEIIKHACIKDQQMFKVLETKSLAYYRSNTTDLKNLVAQNISIKSAVVTGDETENGERMLLNFGHTAGHAIEQLYSIPHGQAISIGMMVGCKISEEINGFYSDDVLRVKALLNHYGLPTSLELSNKNLFEALLTDKKRDADVMNYILLDKIGQGSVHKISLTQLEDLFVQVIN